MKIEDRREQKARKLEFVYLNVGDCFTWVGAANEGICIKTDHNCGEVDDYFSLTNNKQIDSEDNTDQSIVLLNATLVIDKND